VEASGHRRRVRAPRLAGASPEGEYSKRVRVSRSLAALADANIPAVAERIVTGTMPLSSGPAARFAIEDVLWAGQGAPEIPKRIRSEIARDLDRDLDVLTRKADRFMALLESLWAVNDSQLGFFARDDPASLRGQIEQHVLRNPSDWTAEDLSEQLGAFDAGDARFGRFIEGLVSADLIPRRAGAAGHRRRHQPAAARGRSGAARDRQRRRVPGIQRRSSRRGASRAAEEPRLRLTGKA
jgi:hypothetical protein